MLVNVLGTTRGVLRFPEVRREATPDQFALDTGIVRWTIREPNDAAETVSRVLEDRPHVGGEQDVDWLIFEEGGAVSQSIEVTTRILFDVA